MALAVDEVVSESEGVLAGHPRARFYDAVITEPAEVPVLSR